MISLGFHIWSRAIFGQKAPADALLTESGDYFITEAGEYLVQE